MAVWYDLDTIRVAWPDAEMVDDDTLGDILSASQEAVLSYAPSILDEDGELPAEIPESYRHAQLLQSRNIWNSSYASPSGDLDNGSFSLSTFPLDWQVRQLLRPKRGIPSIA